MEPRTPVCHLSVRCVEYADRVEILGQAQGSTVLAKGTMGRVGRSNDSEFPVAYLQLERSGSPELASRINDGGAMLAKARRLGAACMIPRSHPDCANGW